MSALPTFEAIPPEPMPAELRRLLTQADPWAVQTYARAAADRYYEAMRAHVDHERTSEVLSRARWAELVDPAPDL